MGPPNRAFDINHGRAALDAYIHSAQLDSVEATQDYTITDAIVSLLKLARARGFDARSLHRSALDHFETEEPLLWNPLPDGECYASWPHGSGVDFFSISRRGSKFVLTFGECRLEAGHEGKFARIGEYDSVADARADAQRAKRES